MHCYAFLPFHMMSMYIYSSIIIMVVIMSARFLDSDCQLVLAVEDTKTNNQNVYVLMYLIHITL